MAKDSSGKWLSGDLLAAFLGPLGYDVVKGLLTKGTDKAADIALEETARIAADRRLVDEVQEHVWPVIMKYGRNPDSKLHPIYVFLTKCSRTEGDIRERWFYATVRVRFFSDVNAKTPQEKEREKQKQKDAAHEEFERRRVGP